jgi:hypothetical protein
MYASRCVYRGGSWGGPVQFVRTACRNPRYQSLPNLFLGLRLSRRDA